MPTSSRTSTVSPPPLPCCGGQGGLAVRPGLADLSSKVSCAVLHSPPTPGGLQPGSRSPGPGKLAQQVGLAQQDGPVQQALPAQQGGPAQQSGLVQPGPSTQQGPPTQGPSRSLDQLHRELQDLREDLEHMKRQHNKEIELLMNELDEEKRVRLTLQMELKHMKKHVLKLLDRRCAK
ncbi:hypothetical protein CRUP_028682 [Coryphaenoides rupestris]|nr:hypothetical protein CRUP_028682 [Coryphaenoides rupestris]